MIERQRVKPSQPRQVSPCEWGQSSLLQPQRQRGEAAEACERAKCKRPRTVQVLVCVRLKGSVHDVLANKAQSLKAGSTACNHAADAPPAVEPAHVAGQFHKVGQLPLGWEHKLELSCIYKADV